MKRTLCLASLCLLPHTAWADTRDLTSDFQFAEPGQEVRFHVDWPLTLTKNNEQTFTIRYADGTPYLQSSIRDPDSNSLFSSDNMVGEYRYYHSNGKLKRQGHWGNKGNPVGKEFVYSEQGLPIEEKLYPTPTGGWSVTTKSWYESGQLRDENIGYDGYQFRERKSYYANGKLKTKYYHKTQSGVVKDISEHYNQRGMLDKRTEKYGTDPVLEITYNANKKIIKKSTSMISQDRYKDEEFNNKGQLTDLGQYKKGHQKDGRQIQTYDDNTIYSFYKDGVQEGEQKRVKDGKVVDYRHYVNGKLTGNDFLMREDGSGITFSYSDTGKEKIYVIDIDYIHYDKQGMPIVKLPFKLDSRIMPNPGTVWRYSFDGKTQRQITLSEVKDNIVIYQAGARKVEENLHDFTWVSPEEFNRKILSFPLTPGKTWKNSYQAQIKVPSPAGQEWEYTYKAKSTSYISAVEKITVTGGTFDTLVIERMIHWTKSNPHYTGTHPESQMVCGGDSCELEGYTSEIMWYAPAIGRDVLKIVEMSGSPMLISRSSQSALKNSNAFISELTGYGSQLTINKPLLTMKYAHEIPENAFIQGFPMMMNNTWEFAMSRHPITE